LKLSLGDIILEFRVENEPWWILELASGFLPCNGGLRCGDVILEFPCEIRIWVRYQVVVRFFGLLFGRIVSPL
jgi:hypothetical protein